MYSQAQDVCKRDHCSTCTSDGRTSWLHIGCHSPSESLQTLRTARCRSMMEYPSAPSVLVLKSNVSYAPPYWSACLTISTLCFRFCLCPSLELFVERYVVEKRPRIIKLGVPRPLEILHGLNHAVDFVVTNQG